MQLRGGVEWIVKQLQAFTWDNTQSRPFMVSRDVRPAIDSDLQASPDPINAIPKN
jgi:hypothetical protein